MLKVDKSNPPEFIKELKLKFGTMDKATQIREFQKNMREINLELMKETNNRCTYCEQKLGVTSRGEADHFYPKSKFQDKILDWDNLFISCTICNYQKKDYTPESVLDPGKDPVDSILEVDKNGVLIVNDNFEENMKKKAENTIMMFNLNRVDLVETRLFELKTSENADIFSKALDQIRLEKEKKRARKILINDSPNAIDLLGRKSDADNISSCIKEILKNNTQSLLVYTGNGAMENLILLT